MQEVEVSYSIYSTKFKMAASWYFWESTVRLRFEMNICWIEASYNYKNIFTVFCHNIIFKMYELNMIRVGILGIFFNA